MTKILKGKPVSEIITKNTKKIIENFEEKIIPKIAIIRLGDDPGDKSYERSVINYTNKLGIKSDVIELSEKTGTVKLIEIIKGLNEDKSTNGIMILRPLPIHIDEDEISKVLAIEKDIDCMNPYNLAEVFKGNMNGFVPCTAKAIIEMLKYNQVDLSGKDVVVVNRTVVVGKPVAMMLLNEDASVTICHSKTDSLRDYTRNADVVVTAMGQANYFDSSYFKEDSIVIDVGMSNGEDGTISGDVNIDEVLGKIKMITPVFGGIGSITTSILINQMIRKVMCK